MAKDAKKTATKYKLRRASDMPEIEYVTTGFPELDEIVKFPRKRITEIYGLQAVGKTSLTLKSIAGLTQSKEKTLFIDVENSFNAERAKDLGVDLEKLDIIEVSLVEEVSEVIMENLNKYDAIVVDSVAAMVPRAEYEGMAGDANIGLKARLMGQMMRRIIGPLGKSRCALIFINQLRESLDAYGLKYSTPGGMALKFAASVRIELKTTSKDRIIKDGERSGHWIVAEVTKSKVGKPHQTARFKLLY